jgi:predicted DNA-binding transcriptional regulator AlpA
VTAAVYTAAEVAERFGCSTWSVYDLVRRDEFPVEPIRLGRKLVWSRSAVDARLGITAEESA